MQNVSISFAEFIVFSVAFKIAIEKLIINEPRGVPMRHFSSHFDETVSVAFNRTNRIQLNCMRFGAERARALLAVLACP